MPEKSAYAAPLIAALESLAKYAETDTGRIYNGLWTEQGGKLADQYRIPWDEMHAAGVVMEAFEIARQKLRAALIEGFEIAPVPVPDGAMLDVGAATESVTVSRE